MSDAVTIEVGLGARAYQIRIGKGLVAKAGSEIAALKPGARTAIVTDENVASRHLETLTQGLAKASTPSISSCRRAKRPRATRCLSASWKV